MRERAELLVGRRDPGDVGDDVPRRLRPDAARRRRPARLHPPVHDLRPGRLAPAGQALPRRARGRPQALHARAAIQSQISDAKNKLRDAEAYGRMVGSFFEQTVADVYRLYERELHRMNAMDFDDLLVRAVNVLELFPEVRDRYANGFRHVLVDEYQDTNHAQYRWLQLLAGRAPQPGGGRRRCAVPVEGTPVTMADGSATPIEDVEVGDEVLSCYGSGDFRPARVLRTSPVRARSTGSRSPRGRAAARQHARARALRRVPGRPHAAAAHDVPDVAPRPGLPRRHLADVHERPGQAGRRGRSCARRRSAPTRRG